MDAILSIKSIYATAIYQGIKTIEVRKTSINICERIYLYETAPKACITGFIKIAAPMCISIDRIIQEFKEQTMLTEAQIRAYAGPRQQLYLWPIVHAERCKPMDMISRAPQSFYYI